MHNDYFRFLFLVIFENFKIDQSVENLQSVQKVFEKKKDGRCISGQKVPDNDIWVINLPLILIYIFFGRNSRNSTGWPNMIKLESLKNDQK